jgi:hypothetical protein
MLARQKSADIRHVTKKSRPSQSVKYGGPGDLCSQIKELAKSGELLKGIKIDIEQLEATGSGRDEIVNLEFCVPRQVIESVDQSTGAVHVTSGGARFEYTFTGRLPLPQNLKRFRSFYAKRAKALADPPTVRTNPKPQAASFRTGIRAGLTTC